MEITYARTRTRRCRQNKEKSDVIRLNSSSSALKWQNEEIKTKTVFESLYETVLNAAIEIHFNDDVISIFRSTSIEDQS